MVANKKSKDNALHNWRGAAFCAESALMQLLYLGEIMRIARLSQEGIMVNNEALHKLGPVGGAIKMVADLLDNTTKYYSVRYEGKRSIHLAIEEPHKNIKVLCGLPAEGNARLWELRDKKVTCLKCLRESKKI